MPVRRAQRRGSNAIVVGSSYVIEDAVPKHIAKAENTPFIYAPPELSTKEINALHGLIERFLPGTSPLGGQRALPLDNGHFFLALLYRLFPETRYPISSGLGQDAAVTEDRLRQRGRETMPERRLGTLGEALRKAGIEASDSILAEAIEEIAGEASDQAGKLVFLVMVPGRLGLRVPIDLLMRTVGRVGIEHVIALLEGCDLFRWYEDAAGELYIQPRLTLEARLICNRRLGGPQAEMDFARQLLENVNSSGAERGAEIRFARDLSHAMGPHGLEKGRYDSFYEQVADILSEMRSRRSIVDIGLMLQEAMLRREYVRIF